MIVLRGGNSPGCNVAGKKSWQGSDYRYLEIIAQAQGPLGRQRDASKAPNIELGARLGLVLNRLKRQCRYDVR